MKRPPPAAILPAPMRHALARVLLATTVTLAALPACRSTELMVMPPTLEVLEPLPITLSESLRAWRTERAPVTRTRYRVGTVLASLFAAHDGRAFLSPLAEELVSAFDAAEGSFVAHYELRLSLQLDGRLHEIVAHGTGRSREDAAGAERSAVADCLGVLYESARQELARRDA